MIEMLAYLEPRFSMDFYLMPTDPGYLSRLQRMAADDGRIRFLSPVPMLEIPRMINGYDVGVFLLEPGNFNYLHALPNKLFEFIQGRVAVAIGPSPEMARLVRQYDCGVVADGFSPKALAERLNAVTSERLDYYKRQSHAAAAELCYENSSQTLISVLASVTEPRH
jgi:glycosyltransferase involved in cell wall biosynthesis